MSEKTLRIVVADDQASVREGLVALLGMLPGIEVTGAAADGEQALELVASQQPDAILLDLHMPVLDGIAATRRLTEQHPGVAVVVLTTYDDDASILAALQAGARSYLTKDATRADIAQALRSAAAGLSVLDPAVQARLLAAASAGTAAIEATGPIGAAGAIGGTGAMGGTGPAMGGRPRHQMLVARIDGGVHEAEHCMIAPELWSARAPPSAAGGT